MPESAAYERRDISPRAVVWSAIGLVLSLVVIFLVLRLAEAALSKVNSGGATRTVAPRVEVPPPRLQTNPASDLARLRAEEDAKLNSYGWIDRRSGVIRIPIERAMELTAGRGLPVRPATKGDAP